MVLVNGKMKAAVFLNIKMFTLKENVLTETSVDQNWENAHKQSPNAAEYLASFVLYS